MITTAANIANTANALPRPEMPLELESRLPLTLSREEALQLLEILAVSPEKSAELLIGRVAGLYRAFVR
jgi:hypothetical protein